MDRISTANFKSIKQVAHNFYGKASNMAPTRESMNRAVKFYLLSAIPAALGQDHDYGITRNEVIMASVFGSVAVIGASFGIVAAIYCCLQRSALAEDDRLLPQDEPVTRGTVIRSIDPEHTPLL